MQAKKTNGGLRKQERGGKKLPLVEKLRIIKLNNGNTASILPTYFKPTARTNLYL